MKNMLLLYLMIISVYLEAQAPQEGIYTSMDSQMNTEIKFISGLGNSGLSNKEIDKWNSWFSNLPQDRQETLVNFMQKNNRFEYLAQFSPKMRQAAFEVWSNPNWVKNYDDISTKYDFVTGSSSYPSVIIKNSMKDDSSKRKQLLSAISKFSDTEQSNISSSLLMQPNLSTAVKNLANESPSRQKALLQQMSSDTFYKNSNIAAALSGSKSVESLDADLGKQEKTKMFPSIKE